GRVVDYHVVVPLERLLPHAQDLQSVLCTWLANEHLLEATLERRVSPNPPVELSSCSGTYHAKIAADERGFQHVGHVHCSAQGNALPHQVVKLVNEENHVALAGGFVHHSLHSFLILPSKLRAGEQRHVIEGEEAHGLECRWPFAG